MVNENEFSHVIKLDEIGAGESTVRLSADRAATKGLATRFELAALESLDAELAVSRDSKGILAEGRISSTLSQYCIATGEPVPTVLDEPVKIRFVPEPVDRVEIELEADDCDSMFYDGQSIDLGEAVAQSLGLALNPYPRSPGAAEQLKAAGVKSEDEIAPTGALAGLRDLLAKK